MVHTPMMNVIAGFVTLQLILIAVFIYKYISYTSFYSPWFSGRGENRAPPTLDTEALLSDLEPDRLEAPPNATTVDGSAANVARTFAESAEAKCLHILSMCLHMATHKERCPGLYKHAVEVLLYDFADLSSTFDLDEAEIVPMLFESVEQEKYFHDAIISSVGLLENIESFDPDAPHAYERASMFISYHLQWFDETARKIAKYKRGRIAHDELLQQMALQAEFDRRAAAEQAARTVKSDL